MNVRERNGLRCALGALLLLAVGAHTPLHAQARATLTGVIRDSSGAGIGDVEVTLRDVPYAARSDAAGRFTLTGVPLGTYRAFFRRLGYRSVEYTWAPAPDEKTTITVVLERIPQTLDPVNVRAEEDKRYAANASIQGIVVDSAGYPIPEAEVQVVGANAAGMTRSNGGFLFDPLGVGAYVLRVRKLGYAPVTLTVDLHQDDDREVYVRMTPLAQGLDPMVISERSGFGPDQRAWDELEQRKRFVEFDSRILGPDDLKRYHDWPIASVAQLALGPDFREDHDRVPARFRPDAMSASMRIQTDEGCVLINGTTPSHMPLAAFFADDIEMLEIYPVNTELTGTVSKYFTTGKCAATSVIKHPTYYVVWLKQGRAK